MEVRKVDVREVRGWWVKLPGFNKKLEEFVWMVDKYIDSWGVEESDTLWKDWKTGQFVYLKVVNFGNKYRIQWGGTGPTLYRGHIDVRSKEELLETLRNIEYKMKEVGA